MKVESFKYEGNECEIIGNPWDVNLMSNIKGLLSMDIFERAIYDDVVCNQKHLLRCESNEDRKNTLKCFLDINRFIFDDEYVGYEEKCISMYAHTNRLITNIQKESDVACSNNTAAFHFKQSKGIIGHIGPASTEKKRINNAKDYGRNVTNRRVFVEKSNIASSRKKIDMIHRPLLRNEKRKNMHYLHPASAKKKSETLQQKKQSGSLVLHKNDDRDSPRFADIRNSDYNHQQMFLHIISAYFWLRFSSIVQYIAQKRVHDLINNGFSINESTVKTVLSNIIRNIMYFMKINMAIDLVENGGRFKHLLKNWRETTSKKHAQTTNYDSKNDIERNLNCTVKTEKEHKETDDVYVTTIHKDETKCIETNCCANKTADSTKTKDIMVKRRRNILKKNIYDYNKNDESIDMQFSYENTCNILNNFEELNNDFHHWDDDPIIRDHGQADYQSRILNSCVLNTTYTSNEPPSVKREIPLSHDIKKKRRKNKVVFGNGLYYMADISSDNEIVFKNREDKRQVIQDVDTCTAPQDTDTVLFSELMDSIDRKINGLINIKEQTGSQPSIKNREAMNDKIDPTNNVPYCDTAQEAVVEENAIASSSDGIAEILEKNVEVNSWEQVCANKENASSTESMNDNATTALMDHSSEQTRKNEEVGAHTIKDTRISDAHAPHTSKKIRIVLSGSYRNLQKQEPVKRRQLRCINLTKQNIRADFAAKNCKDTMLRNSNSVARDNVVHESNGIDRTVKRQKVLKDENSLYSLVRVESTLKTIDGRTDSVMFSIRDYKIKDW